MDTKQLKPCPLCRKRSLWEEVMDCSPPNTYILCLGCGMRSGVFRSGALAAVAWNTRPLEGMLQKRIAELEANE